MEAGVEVGIETVGSAPLGPKTVIVCVVVALCPNTPTTPLIVRLCTPTSIACGIHENCPAVLMLLFETVEFTKLSLTLNALGEKLTGVTRKEVVVPTGTMAAGETRMTLSVGPAPT